MPPTFHIAHLKGYTPKLPPVWPTALLKVRKPRFLVTYTDLFGVVFPRKLLSIFAYSMSYRYSETYASNGKFEISLNTFSAFCHRIPVMGQLRRNFSRDPQGCLWSFSLKTFGLLNWFVFIRGLGSYSNLSFLLPPPCSSPCVTRSNKGVGRPSPLIMAPIIARI